MVHALSVSSGVGLTNGADARVEKLYRMPKPTLGTVMWRPQDGSGGDCYAIVTAVYNSMIDVAVFATNSIVRKFGVKHSGDPSLKTMKANNVGGVWDFCPGETELRGVIEQQAALLEELSARLAARSRRRVDEGAEPE